MPHYARWGPSSPPQKGAEPPPPIFGPFLLWPNGWMHQDATWYGGRAQPRRLCVRWGPSFPSPTGAQSPNFRPMSFVAKRLDGLRWHLAWRLASAQATLCSMGTKLPPEQRAHPLPPSFWPMFIVAKWLDE